jgi:HNH endonuclease
MSCILWTGAKNSAGYPITWYKGKAAYAHRVVMNAPDGVVVLHKCDTPLCINPEHLSIGTSKQNSEDMVKKNRQAKGESCGNSKLTEKQVLEILTMKDIISSRTVSVMFNCSKTNILDIWNKKIWKHLK